MDKTSLLELKRRMFLRSALIPIDNLDELLSLNDYVSGDEVFYELILKDNGSIHAIQFDEETLSWYDEEDKEDRLIIDIIYEGGV